MTAVDIRKWVKENQYTLDFPEVFTPDMNSTTKAWEDYPESVKYCFVSLVEYAAFIANMGVAILYEDLNFRQEGIIAERAYYPEPKLRRKISKENIPHFSKETFHPLRDFDVLGFSAYYPLQFFGVPDVLEISGIPYLSVDRTEDHPLIIMGGVAAFNPSPVHKFIDCFFLGDGEIQLAPALHMQREMKAAGATKDEILLAWQKSIPGAYVPKFYEERYFAVDDEKHPNQVEGHYPLRDDVPKRIRKAVAEISEIYPLTKMFASNSEGSEMSIGSLEITRGCGNKCQFCEGSFRSQPYRERPVEMIKDAFPKLIRNTGVKAVTPYGFNLSDHHNVNDIIYFLLEDEDRKVSMSSQHIDHFNEEFAKIAYASGNRSITLAIESPTDRMRRKIAKNLTEEKILEVFDIVFRIGFAKVKIYMIANLPEETQEDIDYLITLAGKIHDIQVRIQGDIQKTKIRFSWTPYNGKAHTPLQWAKVGDLDEEGLPIMKKTLTEVMEGLRGYGYGFRVGTDSELSVVNQCMSFGDRRMADVIEDTFKDKAFSYRGGMSIGFRKPMVEFLNKLRARGLDYEFITREKDRDQVFSWDFINMGITKKFLERAYFENYKIEENLSRCQDSCEKCGGCTPVSAKLFKKYQNNELKPSDQNVLELLEKRFKKQVVNKLRFKIYVNEDFRFVHASKIKNYIRRAFMRCDLPIKNAIVLSSDKLKFNDWTYGIDYGEIALYSAAADLSNICDRLNATFDDNEVLKFLLVDKFSDSPGSFCSVYENILYNFSVPKEDRTFAFINSAIKGALDKSSLIIKLKVQGDKQGTTKTVEFDARPLISDIWCKDEGNFTKVYALLSENIGVYELFPALFATSKRNILKYPVFREEYTLSVNEGAQSMFASLCEECGAEIEEDVLGDTVHETLCLKHRTLQK